MEVGGGEGGERRGKGGKWCMTGKHQLSETNINE